MRIGRSFAAKLDPQNILFEEAGQLQLMPEELWPGAPGQNHQQQQQQPPPITPGADHGADLGGTDLGNSSSYTALLRLQQVSAEPDSDDDDAGLNMVDDNKHKTASPCHTNSIKAATVTCPDGEAVTEQRGAGQASPAEDDGGLSDADSDVSASSLIAFDLEEDQAAEDWWAPDGLGLPEGKPLSLRAVAAALRKQDDVDAVLDALRKVSRFMCPGAMCRRSAQVQSTWGSLGSCAWGPWSAPGGAADCTGWSSRLHWVEQQIAVRRHHCQEASVLPAGSLFAAVSPFRCLTVRGLLNLDQKLNWLVHWSVGQLVSWSGRLCWWLCAAVVVVVLVVVLGAGGGAGTSPA
jgi:hypothetical protein